MTRRIAALAAVLCFTGLVTQASAQGVPWRDHASPLSFLFGNEIDTHQQTRQTSDGDLFGFLYVTFTGDVTPDGRRVAVHCGEATPPSACVVGWTLRGKQGRATFLYHNADHPVWLVDSRNDIPQPGAFSHFHWLGQPQHPDGLVAGQPYEGYFLELFAVRRFAFEHAGERLPVSPGFDLRTHLNIVTSVPAD
jgi:hypothetical protein